MERKKRRDSELRQASRHLFYEAWMFSELAQGLSKNAFSPDSTRNAALEAFAMHARVLLGVLYSHKPRPDDVIAEDYFDDLATWAVPKELPDPLKPVPPRVGAEIAHLSYQRNEVTPDAKKWRFLEIDGAMKKRLVEFLKAVPRDRLAPEWDTQLAYLDETEKS
jgi:hypothetical protein